MSALACKPSPDTDEGPVVPGGDGAVAVAASDEAPVIDASRMLSDLQTLSSDEYAGRYTFSEDLGHAADYLEAEYHRLGIAPVGDAYRVPFMAPNGSTPGQQVAVWVEDGHGGSRQVAGEQVVSLGNADGTAAYADAVGVASLARADAKAVRRKIVLAPAPAPGLIQSEVEAFAAREPAGLVLVGERPGPEAEALRKALGALPFPVAWVDVAAATDWMGVSVDPKRGPVVPKGMRMSMAAQQEPVLEPSFNVLAQIPGREHPEQIVMLGAHYDHIGTVSRGLMCRPDGEDTICNGADDNASGTVMVLEVARAFAQAGIRPSRTIVFAHFAGEELGLLGSKALAAEAPAAPPFGDGRIVAMVNLDMVGRLGEEGLAIGGVGSSDDWMPLLDELGSRGMSVVYERAINGRSDHASFYRNKIPVLFFFTGLHDDYHGPGDHFERINGEGMATIAQLVADLVDELADGHAIAYTTPRSADEGEVMRMPGTDDASVEKRTSAGAPPAAD
ncbi:MAG: M20/M25/M40 family metallo-hydrolase [Myxococcales bacterium]|nr:M20/M25/M40 family metallo-hydrolase [Myxococcales bacterium]